MAKDKKVSVDDLAVMVAHGFDEIREQSDRRFTQIDAQLLEIRLRLDNAAYKYELNELEKRVSLLEKKIA